MEEIQDAVRAYYDDLMAKKPEPTPNVCKCSYCGQELPGYIEEIQQQLPEDLVKKSCGCSNPFPAALEGCTVVDLGCGYGKDVFIAAKLVGPQGKVIGIDRDADRIAEAEKLHADIAKKWGYDNFSFANGFMEDLSSIEDGSVDVVLSNYGVNFSPMKEQVFKEVWRILKDGGEMYFSDYYTSRRMPKAVAEDQLLLGEPLGNAMYIEDFRRLMGKIGWIDLRWITMSSVETGNEDVAKLLGDIKHVSATVRAVKLPEYSEDICEKYGQYTTYNGGVLGMEDAFVLDDSHTYRKGERRTACGNSGAMLQFTRFGKYFTMEGDRETHYGPCCGGLIDKHLKAASSCCAESSSCCSESTKEETVSDCCCGSDTKETQSSCCGGSGEEKAASSDCCCSGDSAVSSSSCCDDSSCCGGVQVDSDGNCCGTSITNGKEDPNLGHKEVVIVDYLCLDLSVCDRCQGTDGRVAKAVELVRPIMDMAGYNIVMNKVIIEDERLAERFEFRSSPTVRVNGVDICPTVIENPCSCCESLSDYDVACRQFEFNGKLYEVAPTAFIVKRLLEIVFHNEKDPYPPYEMPENIRGFLQGKAKKDAEKAASSQGDTSCCCGCC